jgi:hypothetical protein
MLPDLQSFPMSTSIPFSCHFITRTKPVHHDDLDHKGEKLFPAPPDSPADVELELKLLGHVRAHGSQHELNVKYDLKGSLGDKASVGNVRITTDEPVWNPLPDHKDKGTWTRGVRFEGFMSFPFAPTFSTATADWHVSDVVIDLRMSEGRLICGPRVSTSSSSTWIILALGITSCLNFPFISILGTHALHRRIRNTTRTSPTLMLYHRGRRQ